MLWCQRLFFILRQSLELVEELPLRHGASKRAVDGGVGHFAGGDAGDGDFALDVLTPPAAVDSDVGFSRMGWVHA